MSALSIPRRYNRIPRRGRIDAGPLLGLILAFVAPAAVLAALLIGRWVA